MKWYQLGFVAVLLVALVAGMFVRQWHSAGVSPEPPSLTLPPVPVIRSVIGERRPDFSLADVEGVTRHISEWDGQVILMNFWATWCLPCLTEIPELVALQDDLADRGFVVLGIALQNRAELPEFMARMGMNYPVLAGEAEVIPIAEEYGNLVGALPYTAIIDRKGRIIYTHAGPVTGADMKAEILPLL